VQCNSTRQCPGENYFVPCSPTSDSRCAPCTECGSDEYVSQPCSAHSDTICTRCKQCDLDKEWMTVKCSHSNDSSCEQCKECGVGEYVGQPCSTNNDTTCTRCKQCDWGNQWMQRRCSDSSNHLNFPGNDTVCRPVNTKPVLRFSSVNYNCHDNTYFCGCCCL
jgi:hypothetical protein